MRTTASRVPRSSTPRKECAAYEVSPDIGRAACHHSINAGKRTGHFSSGSSVPASSAELSLPAASLRRWATDHVAETSTRDRSHPASPAFSLTGGQIVRSPGLDDGGKSRGEHTEERGTLSGRGNRPDYLLGTQEGWGALRIVRWHSVEDISHPFRYSITLLRPRDEGAIDLDALVDTGATLCIRTSGSVRVVHGIIAEAQEVEQTRILRVSEPWGGVGYGAMWTPRVGDLVIVGFREGDPDDPVIVGRAYSTQMPAPYDAAKHPTVSTFKTRSSPGGDGFNELRFEDAAGAERVDLTAQRDLEVKVGRDCTVMIGRHENVTVRGDVRRTVVGRQVDAVEGDAELSTKGQLTISGGGSGDQLEQDDEAALGGQHDALDGRGPNRPDAGKPFHSVGEHVSAVAGRGAGGCAAFSRVRG